MQSSPNQGPKLQKAYVKKIKKRIIVLERKWKRKERKKTKEKEEGSRKEGEKRTKKFFQSIKLTNIVWVFLSSKFTYKCKKLFYSSIQRLRGSQWAPPIVKGILALTPTKSQTNFTTAGNRNKERMSSDLTTCTVISVPAAPVDVSDRVLWELSAKSKLWNNTTLYVQVKENQLLLEDFTWSKSPSDCWIIAFPSQALAILEFLNSNMAIVQWLPGRRFCVACPLITQIVPQKELGICVWVSLDL